MAVAIQTLPPLDGHTNLIGLHLTEFDLTRTDDLILDMFAMFPGFALPCSHSAFIQVEGCHNRSDRASKGKQGQHQYHNPDGIVQTIQGCAFGFGERALAGMADQAPF